MKTGAVRFLLLLNAALAAGLALMWLQRDGSLRNVAWSAPQPVSPPLKSLIPTAANTPNADDMRSFIATLDRPLFTATRRPPPPPAAAASAAPPPPPDPLASLRIFGVYGSEEGGGIIAQVDGKNRVIRVRESVGAWTIKGVDDRTVTLVRGEETRVLRLAALTALPPPPDAASVRNAPRAPAARPRAR